MEKEYKISFFKVTFFIIIFLVIIGLILILLPKNYSKSNNVTNTYITNINMMKEAGFEYFKGTNLPSEISSSKKLTLEEMIESKLMVEFFDEQGHSCDLKNSYIKTTKQLDNEYAMKVYLSCDQKEDYIVTTISDDTISCLDCNASSSNSDKKVDNSINNSYNTTNNYGNSSSQHEPSTPSKPSSSSSNKGTYVTNYNINYVNSCDCKYADCNSCTSNIYYSVNFETNGGDYVPRQIVKYNDYAKYVSTFKSGYEFLGWYTDSNLTYKYDFNTPITNTLTLYAKWQKLNATQKFLVSFDSNGGSSVKSQTVIENSYATVPNNPTRKCYRFVGWYLNGVKYDFTTPVRGNITLTAKWEDDGSCTQNNYLVKFDSNGGSSVGNQTITEGNYVTRPANPTRSCYRFVAWHLNSVNGPIYNFNNRVYNNFTLVAEWEDDGSCRNTYSIYFDSNGGSNVGTKIVEEGMRVSRPTNPTRNGYKFVGWYYNNQEFNFNTRIYQNYTLVAKWEKEKTLYHTYCKIETERHYSVSWVNANTSSNVNWTIRFDRIKNASNLFVTDIGYLTTTNDYNLATAYSQDKPISMVGGNKSSSVKFYNSSTLKTYSLKSNNFAPKLYQPYKSGNYWYVKAYYSYNTIGVTPYYASNINGYINFVPFYFDIRYRDDNNCVTDLASNERYYHNYEIVDSFYL